jgi:hypothetical protein
MSRKRALILISLIILIAGGLVLTAYADFLNPDHTLDLQVTRIGPQSPFPQAVTSQFASAGQVVYTNYRRVTDDIESISMRVPTEWDDIETGPWMRNGRQIGIFIAAAPDLDKFYNSDLEPGVFFGVSRDLAGKNRVTNPALVLNPAVGQVLGTERANRQNRCRHGGRFGYQNDFFRGEYDSFLDCKRAGQGELVIVTMPAHQEFVTVLRIGVVTQADLDAAAHILDTYQVLNPSLDDEHHDH